MAQHTAVAIESVELPDDFDLLALHASWPDRYPFLLESVATSRDARGLAEAYDILFAFPGETLRLDQHFHLHGPMATAGNHFLPALDAWWRSVRLPRGPDSSLPFTGGWFLFLGYELVRQVEPSIGTPAPLAGPVAFATRIPVALVRDRRANRAWIVAEDGQARFVDILRNDIETCRGQLRSDGTARQLVSGIVEPAPGDYLVAVEEVRRRIARGDVYQVNLARHWRATLDTGVRPVDIYAELRRTNPAPFAGIATLEGWTLISSSPERLVRSRGGVVEARPIAGTRPTADDPALEEGQRRDLLANPKERAEHIMLIDLERNDLGRISQPGSVEVDEFMIVESYAHVHHIVSNVRGRLRPDVSPGVLIAAMFPGGTITGCPKVRCMEIIGELEAAPRGPYTGSMGYLNRDGSCDLNILIRSFLVQDRALSFAAGSGIVADSDPVQELEETRAKAKGLLLAIGA
ncbi:MAG: aminodeoxychorismate synthase component I [Gammaproteobacteria bacterium]|nr:aminodeoxychorismate synthase component I [Gammaproteobacteria bacterium]